MILYLLAALALAVSLALFAMALGHKTLLDAGVRTEMMARLDRLTPERERRWGRMSAAQMLRHLHGALRMAKGDLEIPPRNLFLRRFPIKQLVVFVLPFPKDAPTAPALVVKDDVDFEAERKAVRGHVDTFAAHETAAWPDHPAFGPLTREQWGILAWKHMDHHLRQFGV